MRELGLFGSAARGEARADSDIDLLVEFLPQARIGLMDYAGLMLDLSKLEDCGEEFYLKGISTSVKLPGVAAFTAAAILSRCSRTSGHC